MKHATRTILIATLLLLLGCQSTPELKLNSPKQLEKLANQIKKNYPENVIAVAKQAKTTEKAIKQDIETFKSLFAELEEFIVRVWGEKEKQTPTNKKYVKYSNNYQARAIVDFEQGLVSVETIATEQPMVKLKQAITMTLLTSDDPKTNDIFSDKQPEVNGIPFLYPQVNDHDGTVVRYRWRAERFADYLIANRLSKRGSEQHTIYSVNFSLVDQHQHLRQEKYSDYVITAAKRYGLTPQLIYAIIETESSFNPYAVSHANALGLMQVVPATAGKDVYRKIKNKQGEPSRATLFDPAQNIDIGSAYLSILAGDYLNNITTYASKEYSMISGYNGGAGNVLKTFHSDRTKAFNTINRLSSAQVFHELTRNHPKQESRRYLEKVTSAKKNYMN